MAACVERANAVQSCCSHRQSDRPALENMLLKLQQLYDSLANTACVGNDDAALLKALAEQHESTTDMVDPHQIGSSHLHQQLPPIHHAILQSDALAVQNLVKTRFCSLNLMT